MKSQYDFFEIREVQYIDEFANYNNIGFIAPIKTCFKNDWKFCFVYDWTFFKETGYRYNERMKLADRHRDYHKPVYFTNNRRHK